MKHIVFVFLMLTATIANGQIKYVQINNLTFTFKTILENTDYSDEPIKKVAVYRNGKKLLTHTVSGIWGDDNSESIELGFVETTDSTITFFSYWARAGDAPVSPFGVRTQVYLVNANGNLILKDAEIYIETSRKGWPENKGIKYLFSKPNNEIQKTQLLQYIRQVEKEYNATFVFGPKADLLFKTVKAKLKTQIQAATKNWKAIYSTGAFGYKI